ncbi:elongator complex protein 2 [Toxorhynchites rutilus septentrionalis]|uniref:elongator complex protein 2 n=1 Tax=Toxorhynchites rutilus septentrionalis TaxID=329112 RepID=UPI0024793CF5|nr:elongator complex protein 2 [Toxorhynchites rutilus septentrionalis]
MEIKNLYTSVACNRTPGALDWGQDGLIYYAACHAISVFDPNFHGSSKIIQTLSGHKARVNTVKKLNAHSNETSVDLISGSDDATCILWNTRDALQPIKHRLQGHTKGITHVAAIYQHENLTVATGSVDSSIKLWRNDGQAFKCFQTIDLKTSFCFALKFLQLPGSECLMLAYASDNDAINLCTVSNDEFVPVEKLTGHSDWVRGLDCVEDVDSEDLLLASSSQDSFIRLWRISKREHIEAQKSFEEFSADEDIVLEERVFSVTHQGSSFFYALSLESVLQGHEGWVYGVHFHKQGSNLRLLSSSIDKTLIVWAPSESGIWFESVRVGEVGGGSLGFYGGKMSPDGRAILGHGFQGSLHLWHQDKADDKLWTPGIIVGGHFESVRDLTWEPEGQFLVTLSADQTTRIHAGWKRDDANESTQTWHEIARPQVHGYDMQCLCMLSRYRFASGAEEKIVRIFQAPGNYVENLRQLCGITSDSEGDNILKTTPKGASVPSLGLSNKPVYNIEAERETKHVKDIYPEHYFTPASMETPPTEETLMQNTLWPEMQKLYGHGYEIYALAATSNGRFLASASRATSTEHAKILIWNTATWKIIQKLEAHQLTVTQIAFAPNNALLLGVSRDRTLSVFENKVTDDGDCDFQLITHTNKKTSVHTRIIWCCDWSHDSLHFSTGSRDGKVVLWGRDESAAGLYASQAVIELKGESVTAVAFAKQKIEDDRYLVATGLETGIVHLYAVRQDWKLLVKIDHSCGHHLTVKRLAFKPSSSKIQLASCGEDNLVRIYDICF